MQLLSMKHELNSEQWKQAPSGSIKPLWSVYKSLQQNQYGFLADISHRP